MSKSKPDPLFLLKIADCVYNLCPPSLNGFERIYQNATIVVYIHHSKKQLVFSLRGTKPDSFENFKKDILQGWSASGIGSLRSTSRYKRDILIVYKFVTLHPTYDVYFTGHSLGGALAQEAMRTVKSKGAMIFNSAYQAQDKFHSDELVKRFHINGDPLIQLANIHGLRKRITILPKKRTIKQVLSTLGASALSPLFAIGIEGKRALEAHKVENFYAHKKRLTW